MTEREFYEIVRQKVRDKLDKDSLIKAFRAKAAKGTATFAEAVKNNSRIASLIGSLLSDFVTGTTAGDGLMEYVCRELLKEQHLDTNDMLEQVQKDIDERNGLKLTVKKSGFPEERVNQIARSLEDATVERAVIQRRAQSAAENVINSYADDFVKENAKFRSDAGLKCYITRATDGNCCKWCSALAGRYVYGEEPDDVFRRHDNCSCTVTYESGRKRQDVWSKKTWEAPEVKGGEYKPTVLSSEQAKALQAKNLQFKGVDKSGGSGIIDVGSDDVAEIIELGKLNTQPLENEFGKLKTDELIITNERIEHIKRRHPEDFELFEKYGLSVVAEPEFIIKDEKNENTVFVTKKLEDTNLNLVVKVILETEENDLKNSVMTFYRIREKNLQKLINKNKTLYKSE